MNTGSCSAKREEEPSKTKSKTKNEKKDHNISPNGYEMPTENGNRSKILNSRTRVTTDALNEIESLLETGNGKPAVGTVSKNPPTKEKNHITEVKPKE